MQGPYDDAAPDAGASATAPRTRPADVGPDTSPSRLALASFYRREVCGCAVLGVAGDIDVATASGFRAALLEAVERSDRLVVDLSGVTFLDCAGLSALAAVVRHMRATGGSLRLVGATGIVGRVIGLTRLDEVVVVEPTVADALASMSPAAVS